MTNEAVNNISYQKPKVFLINESGIGVSEIAARTCYDSFHLSENKEVSDFKLFLDKDIKKLPEINTIESSELLDTLSWTHFHHSILEHSTLSFYIQDTSRGVLQEHARHRIQAISVRSTRYTMSTLLNIFLASFAYNGINPKAFFIEKVLKLDMLVTQDKDYNIIEISTMYDKLKYQFQEKDFSSIASKEAILIVNQREHLNQSEMLLLLNDCKKKRNVGDTVKHIVTDNWKVDLVVTFNIRSLKNYFDLRDSGAAYFQIRWLAELMKESTPIKYLKLIDKRTKESLNERNI